MKEQVKCFEKWYDLIEIGKKKVAILINLRIGAIMVDKRDVQSYKLI